jgi:hypothetical protein
MLRKLPNRSQYGLKLIEEYEYDNKNEYINVIVSRSSTLWVGGKTFEIMAWILLSFTCCCVCDRVGRDTITRNHEKKYLLQDGNDSS